MSDRKTVLVVDPAVDLAEAMTQAFVAAGHESHAVDSGARALETAEKVHIDFAFVEAELPDMTGVQLVKLFMKRQPQIITALTAGDGSLRTALSGLDAGVSLFLPKPFEGVSHLPRHVRDLTADRDFHLRRLHSLSIIDAEHGGERTSPLDRPPIEVLLVEPDGAVRGELAATLERRGCVVTGAICGQEALELLQDPRFEALVMAHDMGDMMADDMLGRARRAAPDVGMIVISVQPTLDMVATMIRLGADALVPDALEDHERVTAAVLRHGQAARLRLSGVSLEALVERAAKYTVAPPRAPDDAPPPPPQSASDLRPATYEERTEAASVFDSGLEKFKAKEYDDALVAWTRAVRLHPSNRWYRWNLDKLKRIMAKP